MKTQQELCDILGFIAEYATYQLGSGVHTSRVIRNAQRIGEALGVDVQLSSFQKSTILTVLDTVSGESATRVVAIPSLLRSECPELGRIGRGPLARRDPQPLPDAG